MNELLLMGLVVIGCFPPAYLILKLIFKKTIMFKFSVYMIVYILYITFASFLQGKLGIQSGFVIIPINFAIGTVVFLILNRIISIPLKNAIEQVQKVSEGDLRVEIKETNEKNELGILNNSLVQLVVSFKNIIGEVNANAYNLVAASAQMSQASEQLSQGANMQASSIEEMSATMEEMSANIRNNTDNSMNTEKIASEANDGIKVVAIRARQAVEASQEISEKISVINDIAFQTNILALNAAVEAARAGEHGRGFAVVANEVRRLADKSKEAAVEIVNLAKKSLELSQGAGDVMVKTSPKIDETTLAIQNIAASSREQNNAAEQVAIAMQELNNVTQQNAAASEELASSAEELSAQAEQLKEVITYFKID